MNPPPSVPGVLYVTSYPPRECGIATFTSDLVHALQRQFGQSISVRVCALNDGREYQYPGETTRTIDARNGGANAFIALANAVNDDQAIAIVHVQHEFGLFSGEFGEDLLAFTERITKPLVVTMHTVLPEPANGQRRIVQVLAARAERVVVMTRRSLDLLTTVYNVPLENIQVIPHGTHLSSQRDRAEIKEQFGLAGRNVLSTFGLLSPNKGIETAINALPGIVERFPRTLYCILGITHPGIVRESGESYRDGLVKRVTDLGMEHHVKFVNEYLNTESLLDYLAATDVYLFTSSDPNQAVSGTFSYALASGCPTVATPIPHVREGLMGDMGRTVEFGHPEMITDAVIDLFSHPEQMRHMRTCALESTRKTAWENVAIRHAQLYLDILHKPYALRYSLPTVTLSHLERMSTPLGVIQFAQAGQPDLETGYTLDDNARAAIVVCRHFALTQRPHDMILLSTYIDLIARCQQPDGVFVNYIDQHGEPHPSNQLENLEDANGRAVWALGTILAHHKHAPFHEIHKTRRLLAASIPWIEKLRSPRAMAYVIKGLALAHVEEPRDEYIVLVRRLADTLLDHHRDNSDSNWQWFEQSMTYANAALPEAVMLAFEVSGNEQYRDVARSTFDFLLYHTLANGHFRPISNDGWFHRNHVGYRKVYGEQSIEVCTTIETLATFARILNERRYRDDIDPVMSWYLGNNRLHQIVYDPASGGCYDGLEIDHVNINQGAESTICYLLARLTVEGLGR